MQISIWIFLKIEFQYIKNDYKIMSFLILPIEVIINNILTLFSINDLIEFSKIYRSTNKYVCIYLKCNNCNTKIQKNEDIYGFEIYRECNKLICKMPI